MACRFFGARSIDRSFSEKSFDVYYSVTDTVWWTSDLGEVCYDQLYDVLNLVSPAISSESSRSVSSLSVGLLRAVTPLVWKNDWLVRR